MSYGNPLVVPRPDPAARLRLVCFPYAGGGAAAYRSWAWQVPAGVEVAAVALPGREARLAEPAHTSLDTLLAELRESLVPVLADRPFVFFGHSMGALVAFEMCRVIAGDGLPGPRALIVSGHRAPDLTRPGTPARELSDEQLCEMLRGYGGTPEEIFAEPLLLALILPVLRADLTMVDGYRYRPGPPLALPVIAYGADRDPEAGPAEIAAWARHTSAGFMSAGFAGGHLFIRGDEVIRRLGEDLRRIG